MALRAMLVKFMQHMACLQSSIMESRSVISPASKPVHFEALQPRAAEGTDSAEMLMVSGGHPLT